MTGATRGRGSRPRARLRLQSPVRGAREGKCAAAARPTGRCAAGSPPPHRAADALHVERRAPLGGSSRGGPPRSRRSRGCVGGAGYGQDGAEVAERWRWPGVPQRGGHSLSSGVVLGVAAQGPADDDRAKSDAGPAPQVDTARRGRRFSKRRGPHHIKRAQRWRSDGDGRPYRNDVGIGYPVAWLGSGGTRAGRR